MQEESNVVYGLSEEELEDYTPIVTNAIKEICIFSDKYNASYQIIGTPYCLLL